MDYSTLRQELIQQIKDNPKAQAAVSKMRKAILNKTAKYDDVYELADAIGEATGLALERSAATLADEDLAELATNLINPVYRSMQNTLLSAGKSTQKIFNEKNGLGLNPADVANDEDRLTNIANRFKDASKFDEVGFLTRPYVSKNIAKAAVSDSVKKNADNFNRAGLEVSYIRSDGAGCCDWCSGLVGSYKKENLPADFWRVHKGCTCTFDYKVGGTHTKIKYGTDSEGRLRKETEEVEE